MNYTKTRVCPQCGVSLAAGRGAGGGNRHVAACERAADEFFGTGDRVPEEWRRTTRAAAHAVHAALLEPEQRFRAPVRDLDMAWLLSHLEAGGEVVQCGGRQRWMGYRDHQGAEKVPLAMPKSVLRDTVEEGLRLGLLQVVSVDAGPSIKRVSIRPAPVHLAGPDNLRPACDPIWRRFEAKRWRLVRNRSWVDCAACLKTTPASY